VGKAYTYLRKRMRGLLLLLISSHVLGIQFFLRQAEELCLAEPVVEGDMIVGEFVINPAQSRVGVSVQDPFSAVVYSKSSSSDGKFAYTSPSAGEYRACFTNSGLHQKTVTFVMKKGANAKDYSAIAKKHNLAPMELDLKRAEDTVTRLNTELAGLSRKHGDMQDIYASSNSRSLLFSIFSVLLLVGMAAAQLVYLKRFFVSRGVVHKD